MYFNDNEEIKVLGTEWHPTQDVFQFSSSKIEHSTKNTVTKRTLLSESSKLFDPLGLASPIVIRAKFIMQKVWQEKLAWDEAVPSSINAEWLPLRQDFLALKNISVPRHLSTSQQETSIIYHGFADASLKGYGACIYVTTPREAVDSNDHQNRTSRLVCSKSRVAPLKVQTLPRLELAAALLLVKLLKKVINAITYKPLEIYLWSDSSIALHWIANCSSKWQVFVANRVKEIQTVTNDLKASWSHVASRENPADLISRGVTTEHLKNSTLWWNGPSFISMDKEDWPKPTVTVPSEVPEARKTKILFALHLSLPQQLLQKYSSLYKVLKIVAYCLRFIKNARSKASDNLTSRRRRRSSSTKNVTASEIESALKLCVRSVQDECFQEEKYQLSKENGVLKSSHIRSLHPFTDHEDILRVGGRLQRSTLSFDEKHPMLIPQKHRFTQLLLKQEHERLLHAPPQQLLATVRQKFWPINGPSAVKKVVNKCVTCRRARPKLCSQVMAPLPTSRVTQNSTFSTIGIDYTGPILVKTTHRRNSAVAKAYVALFVCFVTKAIHLELTMDLTTTSFLEAFKRFISRRGFPTAIFSDNSKTFTGASTNLTDFQNWLLKVRLDPAVSDYLAKHKVSWQFIPPNSPHHGGLWERAVQSFKHHFRKLAKTNLLHVDHVSTWLTQIEAVLNSRPLVPLSSSPNDFEALTPGHFLIGRALTAYPSVETPCIKAASTSLVQRFTNFNTLLCQFWSRWQREYLQHLQSASKWYTPNGKIEEGALVIIKDRFQPPLFWRLARVLKLHPGPDGAVRVVTLRTPKSELIRTINEICVLPVDQDK